MGVSACLMAPLTGYRRWLQPATQLRANSWMLMTGSLGMVASTLPVQWLMPVLGWRGLFWGLAALCAVSMLGLAWLVPRWQEAPRPPSRPQPPRGYARSLAPPLFPPDAADRFFQLRRHGRDADAVGRAVDGEGGRLHAAAGGHRPVRHQPVHAGTFWTWGVVNPWLARRGLRPSG